MKKSLIALAVAGVVAVPAFADETPEHTLTGNFGVFSSYRFRGIDQTFGKPAIQGGFDYAHSSGFYAGNWNSNVSSFAGYPDGNLEMDFYGGYKTTVGDFGIDVGGLYYYYPGSEKLTIANAKTTKVNSSGVVNNGELYAAISWQFLTLKYSYGVTDYFSAPDTQGSGYVELNGAYDLGNGWGVNGHVGHLNFKNYTNGSYTDWKLGVTKDINGYVLGLSYVDTNADKTVYKWANTSGDTIKAGKATAVLSISKTF